ncbi:MAG: CPBP family intramembrane metalloprotease, partial [SAR324 cluster bacterium]|nr:CPBP family intramembrane metalloprotease [SAR324 cluster bacterium]
MISNYFKASSHRFYGAVIGLTMLLLYEVLIIWERSSDVVIRNAPEAWLRTVLNFLGISHYHISFIMITVAILAVPLFYKPDLMISKRVFLLLIIESIIWAAFSGVFIQMIIARIFLVTGTMSGSIIGDLGLAIGAGLFEELFFRVILTSALIWICYRLIRFKWLSITFAVIIASFLFSLAHYIGSAGDAFEIYSFLFRFLAGLWFTTLYSVRGFAVVCLTHAFYDI